MALKRANGLWMPIKDGTGIGNEKNEMKRHWSAEVIQEKA
jgi:hypothetical protein